MPSYIPSVLMLEWGPVHDRRSSRPYIPEFVEATRARGWGTVDGE